MDHHVDGDGGEEDDEQDGAGDGEEEVEDPSIYTLNQSLKIPIWPKICTLRSPLFASYDNQVHLLHIILALYTLYWVIAADF